MTEPCHSLDSSDSAEQAPMSGLPSQRSSNPPGQAQAPSTAYAPLSAAVPAQAYPAAAVPAHAILQMSNKRPLNSPEDMGDPQLKRVRFEGSGVQNSGAPGTSAQLAGVQQTAATGSLAGVHSAAPDPSPEDFPVVEALVRREGTDKLKRVQVDGQLNAVERAEAALDERKKICPKSAVDQVLAGLGADEDFVVEHDVKSFLGMLAENMLEETMEFAALMASRRNSKWLQAKDLECYLERMWHISLPGFSSRCVTSAPKIAAESADMKNRASVRTYLAQLPVQQPTDGEKKDETGAAGGS